MGCPRIRVAQVNIGGSLANRYREVAWRPCCPYWRRHRLRLITLKRLVMESDSQAKERQLAITIVEAASPGDRELLQDWITQLLVLKDSPLGILEKAKKAIAVTASSKAAVTAAKIVAKHIKRVAWD